MSVVSGKVTLGTAGTIMVNFGINVNDLDIYMGPRDAVVETAGFISVGHADSGKQFCIVHKDGKSEINTAEGAVTYDGLGNLVLRANVVSGWGTPIITFNVTTPSLTYKPYMVART